MQQQALLNPPEEARQARITFTINRGTGKIVSVAPVVNSDEELAQLEPWIQACLILSDLIRPAKINTRAAA